MRAGLPVMLVVIGAASAWRATPAGAGSGCDSEILIPASHVCTLGGLTTFTLDGTAHRLPGTR